MTAAAAVTAVLVARTTHADERSTAEELFQLGRSAVDAGDVARGCQMLEQSLKLENTLGTLLNVALCHEKLGRLATAWGEFRAVEQRSLGANPPATARAVFAREHAEALRPRLSRLHITVDPHAEVPRIVVRVDGVETERALWAAGIPVDPGERVIAATAPGKLPVELRVTVPDTPTEVSATIPVLADAPLPPAVPSAEDPRTVEAVASARARRAAGYVTGGIGLGFVAAGAVFGGLALGARDDASCAAPCYATVPDAARGTIPNPELLRAEDAYGRANVFANLSTGGFALGAVGVAVGLYLVLTAHAPPRSAVALFPSVSGVAGRF